MQNSAIAEPAHLQAPRGRFLRKAPRLTT